MLDYLAGEVMSRAVFLYIEGISHAAKFMSAARRCSRSKPVIAIKSGRHPEGARAALSHTGALAGSDEFTVQPFAARASCAFSICTRCSRSAEVIARVKSVAGSRLAIITNGGGTGVLAADTLADLSGTLAQLDQKTIERA